jgi:hypothetical protein
MGAQASKRFPHFKLQTENFKLIAKEACRLRPAVHNSTPDLSKWPHLEIIILLA